MSGRIMKLLWLQWPAEKVRRFPLGEQIEIAVSSVFKIVNLSPDRLSVHMNLRDLPVKSLNLNYGCQDVHWNPKEGKRALVSCFNYL